MTDEWKVIISRLTHLIDKAEKFFLQNDATDLEEETKSLLDQYSAFRWQVRFGMPKLVPVRHPDLTNISNLIGINQEIDTLDRNTRQFLCGLPANHVLLWGDRGTGKSSLVKAIFNRYEGQGLRLVEVNKDGLIHLQELTELIWNRRESYVLFCDDLSFDNEEAEYRELKAMLEGSISAKPDNVLIYATSNRRHLMPRQIVENKFPATDQDELYPRETTGEKVSLSDRFGLRIAFQRISKKTYLDIVSHYAQQRVLPISDDELEREAIEWEASSSGRSGRVARQLIDDLEGRLKL
ncbi:MAG: ATP-binding protein [Candidatus Poribacteria bacterium]|nr:ATP-binding protein [Candidatus Poribacteria bacterium]